MRRKNIKTRLVPTSSRTKNVCTFCKKEIKPDEKYFVEEGVEEHLHSLLARRYCYDCYTKYGEKLLSQGEE